MAKQKQWLKNIWSNIVNLQQREIRITDRNGETTFAGNVGDTTNYRSKEGEVICVGDILEFENSHTTNRVPVVILDSSTGKHYVNGWYFGSIENGLVKFSETRIKQKHSELPTGRIEPMLDVCEVLVGSSEKQPQPVNSPYSLVNLATAIYAHDDKFEPALPSTDLLYSLFGGTETLPCPFMPEDLCHIRYKAVVKRWRICKGHYVYTFKKGIAPELLAYIRINEDMEHGPGSFLDRVTHAYHFDEAGVERFRYFLESIHTQPERYGRSEDINEVAQELLLTVLNDTTETQ